MAEKTLFQLPSGGMDLTATLFCGQSFSWTDTGNGPYRGVAGGHAAEVLCEGGILYISPLHPVGEVEAEAAFWRDYFALDTDYTTLQAKLCGSKKLAACVAHTPGMRVLRQPFFDTLLSFIISQNNNLKRITAIAARLRESFGEEIAEGVFAFPTPERLAAQSEEALAPLRAGWRAAYLLDAARKVAAGEVSEAALRGMGDEDARTLLCTIHGVGTKVADCVLLYGLGRQRIVPMDVWMKRAMAQTFPKGMPRAAKGFEGIAQQYIFIWARDNLKK